MRLFLQAVTALVLSALAVRANEVVLDQDIENSQRCSGMYSRKAWGGAVDPFILTKFVKTGPEDEGADPVVSFIVFEWKDEALIGKKATQGSDESGLEFETKEMLCTEDSVKQGYCNETQLGEFILEEGATEHSMNPIITQAVHLNDPPAINYPIKNTGYYCVSTYPYSAAKYKAIVEFRNAYGELPAAQIAKLPFYGGLTIVYAVIGIFWAFLYVQHRHDILPVQNYITAIIGFLIVEMLITWGFYDYRNRHGGNVGAKVMMVIVSILNAFRNSFSFFLLLIVCMGYGVVKPSLGRTMTHVRWLAIGHFTFGVIYAVGSLTVPPENAGPLILLVVLPLAGTLTGFYVWTLNSLKATIADLIARKQNIKALMYKKLWWGILASILVITIFFFVSSFTFVGRGDPDFVPDHWQTRWFILDGWLNLVYLFDIAFVAYLWRPTANNRRFAMSDEIAQDDDGFEIASIGGSLDEEAGGHTPLSNPTPPGESTETSPPAYHEREPTYESGASVSAKEHSQAQASRDSFDGETIFAVGEDADRWSDEDESPRDSSERKRLTGKND
ncbi:putative integral membrane protein [Xylona heveae TC161]|uniref:Putative integral membrane protein n=1 Tax=Xylona heveae (strain CBS 132557 / TC161) TaxID=1328760 RepID=A0A165JV71_XYLHT|nr:putative integral membrane protein [Xylona heveae TC161]KZF26673.1 putative integral membrane protein [Xylona heveae TC161]